jgi:hypothetical protein
MRAATRQIDDVVDVTPSALHYEFYLLMNAISFAQRRAPPPTDSRRLLPELPGRAG